MIRTLSVALLALLMISASVPSIAQKAGQKPGQKSASDYRRGIKIGTKFTSMSALSEGTGVLVRWEMATEFESAGYNVYRLDFDGKHLINRAPMIGSWGRHGSNIAYGEVYQVFDRQGAVGAVYVIESLAMNGRRVSTQPFATTVVKNLEDLTGTSASTFAQADSSNNQEIEADKSSLTTELSRIVESSLQVPNLETHRWVVGQPGAKIGVRQEGLYRISASELDAAEFPIGSDAANWRLFVDGVEQSIIVGANNQFVEFYGKGVDTPESDTRSYYLISGTTPGKRIGSRILRSTPGFAEAANYQNITQKKERFSYVNRIFNGDEENYWGRLVTSSPVAVVPFELTGIDFQTATAQITVRMQGFSLNNHQTQVKVNGHDVTQMTASFYDNYSSTVSIPTTFLLEGTNSLELNTQNGSDYSLFDTVMVAYDRKHQAVQDRISFFTAGYKKVNVTGFSSPNIRVFDITFDGSPLLIANVPVVADNGSFTVKLPSSRTMVSYAVEDSAVLASVSVSKNNPSNLVAATNGADLIIVSHSSPEFMSAADTWADYRRMQGITVKVVDIADVYDEFGFGVASSNALKAFLGNAYQNWQLQPKYVLLLGDGSYDPRNYEGFGYNNLIPTKSVRLIYDESGSDEALADFDGDGLAEMAIGRIPVRTVAAITTIFDKTRAFETPAMQSLGRGALFAHDLPIGYDFAGMNQMMSDELPVGTPVEHVIRGGSTAQSDLVAEMNKGKFIVNYAGHGSTGLWASSSFFGINNVAQLTNSTGPTIFNMLTCLNGFFLLPNNDSLSERLLKSDTGGAVSAWASTSETTADIQLIMGRRFFNKLASGTIPRMGDLVRDAKTTIPAGADVRLSWALLGDPMLQVRPIPAP